MRLIALLILFACVASVCYSVGSLLTFEFAIWRWPASYQVGAVIFTTVSTAILYGIIGIGRDAEPWEQFEEDRR